MSDRLGQQLSKLGMSAKDIEKVGAAWKSYASSAGLAASASSWTKTQASQVRQWEAATVAALRNVARAQRQYTGAPMGRFNGGKAIGGVVGAGAAAVTGYRAKEFGKKAVVSAAEFDIGIRKQREFVDIPKDIQDRVLTPQAKKIGQDTQFSNLDVVKAQTKAMQGLPSSFDAKLRAEVGAAMVEQVKNYALTMEADLAGSAEAIRTFLQTTGKDISTKEKAVAEATRATNLMVKMAKLGGMNDEDVQQFMKFGAATGTAAGLSDTSLGALGAVGRRGGLRGDELGVFVRAISSKLVSPTSKGLDALTAAGIDYNKFTKMPGGLSVDNLGALQQRRFGKNLSGDQRSRLADLLEDPDVVGNKEAFTEQVSQILAEGFDKTQGGKTKAQDSQKIAKMVGDFHKLSTESVDSEGLLNEVMSNPKMSIALLNALFTDKHGGKGSILAKMWPEFRASKGELDKVGNDPDFAKRKADEIMGGLGGDLVRAKGSLENFTLAVGQAVEGVTRFALKTGGDALDRLSDLPPKALGYGAGVAGASGALAGGMLTRAALQRFGIRSPAAGAAGVAGGLGIGGLIGLGLSDMSVDFLKANPDYAKELLSNSMLGALDSNAAFAAGILNAEPPNVPSGAGLPWDRQRRQVTKSHTLWNEGTKPIEHLEGMAGPAGAAGTETGSSFRTNLKTQLDGAVSDVAEAAAKMRALLGFSATPTIAPQITMPGVPGKGASLDSAASKHAAFADYGFDTA